MSAARKVKCITIRYEKKAAGDEDSNDIERVKEMREREIGRVCGM